MVPYLLVAIDSCQRETLFFSSFLPTVQPKFPEPDIISRPSGNILETSHSLLGGLGFFTFYVSGS